MSSKEKLFEKIKSGPNNVRFEDLETMMLSFGFNMRSTSHGGFFLHDRIRGLAVHVAKPHGREKKVLKPYVNQCIDAIERLKEDQNE